MFDRPMIAFDLGSSSLKVVEFANSNRQQLLRLGLELLPEGVIVDGEIRDVEAAAAAARHLLRRLKINSRGRRACISVGGGGVLIKRAAMALDNPDDASEQVFYEAQQLFHHDMADMFFWYQDLHSKIVPDGKKAVLLVGAKRDLIENYVSFCHQLGMKASIVDCSTLCVANMFDYNYPIAQILVMAVQIGARTTQIVLMYEGELLYTREFPLGGHEITMRIAQTMGIEVESAEALKIDLSLGRQPITQELQRIIADVNDLIIQDISQTLSYFFQTETLPEGINSLGYVFLGGGGARSLGLDTAIAASLKVPVQIIDPFHRVNVRKAKMDMNYLMAQGPLYSVSAGLALRRPGDVDKKIA